MIQRCSAVNKELNRRQKEKRLFDTTLQLVTTNTITSKWKSNKPTCNCSETTLGLFIIFTALVSVCSSQEVNINSLLPRDYNSQMKPGNPLDNSKCYCLDNK